LEAVGAAKILDQRSVTGEALKRMVLELISTPDRLSRMGAAARELARPNAGRDLARLVVDTGLGRSPMVQ
jgi:UDP-N-acetylglucosamine:LPS N-acetylglucosamine transferase